MDTAESFQEWMNIRRSFTLSKKNGEYFVKKEFNMFYTVYIKHKDEIIIKTKDNHLKLCKKHLN